MARNLNIFVDSISPPALFAQEIETILGISLEAVSGDAYILYKYSDGEHKWFDIGRHNLEHDRDLNFEDYTYQIEVGVFNLPDWREREKICQDFARFIFDKLKATHKYRLLLVEDVQVKVDEFIPTPQLSG